MRSNPGVSFLWLFVLPFLIGNASSTLVASSTVRPDEERSQELICEVSRSVSQFNPSLGEPVTIRFSLTREARTTVKIFDPDLELVTTLLENETQPAGVHVVVWDGRDLDGSTVPDEAYFFTIEVKDIEGHRDVYDPITFSGGEVYHVAKADFDPEQKGVRYTLEHPGRVLIRMGVYRGPLLRTLVDWQPRRAGFHTEAWDGQDESGVMRIRDDPRFIGSILYYTLPEDALITFGNEKVGYDEYKAGLKTKRPKKADRGRTLVSDRPISPHFGQARDQYRNPKIRVTFPEVKDFTTEGFPRIEGRAVIAIDMAEKDRATAKDRKLELYLFLDNRILMEEGNAQIPYQFHWNFSDLGEGEHILTINLLTDHDQMATASQKIVVKGSHRPGSPGAK